MWLSVSIPVPVSYYSNTHKPKNSLAHTVKMPVCGNASINQLFALWGLVTYTVFGAKPLSEQTLVSGLLSIGPLEQPLMRFESKFNICRGRKWFWKCCLQNDGHLFSKDSVKLNHLVDSYFASVLWKHIECRKIGWFVWLKQNCNIQLMTCLGILRVQYIQLNSYICYSFLLHLYKFSSNHLWLACKPLGLVVSWDAMGLAWYCCNA